MPGSHLKIALLIFSSLLLLEGCDSKDSDNSGNSGNSGNSQTGTGIGNTTGVTDNEILLGTHTDLSGPTAIWGTGTVNGARMRFDELNESGGIHGRSIRLIVEDTNYQVPRGIQAANKLIHKDQIFAMVFALGTQINNTVLTNQMEAGVPNLFPFTGARSMNEPFHKLKFTQRGVYYDEIRAGMRYSLEELGKTRPCVIYQDTDYGHETLDAVNDQAAAMSVEIGAFSAHKPTDTEFTAAVLRLREADCDVVFMGTIHRDTVLILETARKMGWDQVDFVGNDVTYGEVISGLPSGAAEGFMAFTHIAELYPEDNHEPVVADWLARYQERYGQKPTVAAMEGYRGADLLIRALTDAGPALSREALLEALENIAAYRDIFGYRLTFGPQDHKGVDESILSVVKDGRWVTLAESIRY